MWDSGKVSEGRRSGRDSPWVQQVEWTSQLLSGPLKWYDKLMDQSNACRCLMFRPLALRACKISQTWITQDAKLQRERGYPQEENWLSILLATLLVKDIVEIRYFQETRIEGFNLRVDVPQGEAWIIFWHGGSCDKERERKAIINTKWMHIHHHYTIWNTLHSSTFLRRNAKQNSVM